VTSGKLAAALAAMKALRSRLRSAAGCAVRLVQRVAQTAARVADFYQGTLRFDTFRWLFRVWFCARKAITISRLHSWLQGLVHQKSLHPSEDTSPSIKFALLQIGFYSRPLFFNFVK